MSGKKQFVSGDEAIAIGVKLARPNVISAYPITPQTIVVEKLSEYVEDGSLKTEFMHIESEHSAMAAAMGASSVGARTFTATSSQGLLYMAETLPYVSGARFPIVMMNANRYIAVPWSIFGDQSDSLSQLDSGWIQVYVEDAQEALDMIIQAYKIAENEKVLTPFMVNLDGFVLTHTYELVNVPDQDMVDEFIPPLKTINKMDFDSPQCLCMTVGQEWGLEFKYQQHMAILNSKEKIKEVDKEFGDMFGRYYGGLLEEYMCEEADVVLVTTGSVTATSRLVVDKMRGEGYKVGLVKLRYLRPFPEEEVIELGKKFKGIGVLDKDISFGYEGTIFTNINSALLKSEKRPFVKNFVTMGGKDISMVDIERMFFDLLDGAKGKKQENVQFLHIEGEVND